MLKRELEGRPKVLRMRPLKAGSWAGISKQKSRKIPNEAWVLPRPRRVDKYVGCFPQHFEKKLLRRLGCPRLILHPFGGRSEFGLRFDLKREVHPDIIADAHSLPLRSGIMDLVILDPPYSEALSERLYGTAKLTPLKFKEYTQEAVRVLAEGGHLAMYHFQATPAIRGTRLIRRIFVETRVWHHLRCVHIHRKVTGDWVKIGLEEFQP